MGKKINFRLPKKSQRKIEHLGQEMQSTYDGLVKIVTEIPISKRNQKILSGTGEKISIADLIAYQIGWGKCLIRWYQAGIQEQSPEMPGDGFLKWNYAAIAKHFYAKYRYDAAEQQMKIFDEVATQILNITEKERQTGNLDQMGIWPWCTLPSGKQWPLSKWIQVNTVSPYKRAIQLINKAKKIGAIG